MADHASPPTKRRWRQYGLAASAFSCIVVAICYYIQLDWLAAVTLIPLSCWLAPGLILAVFGYHRDRTLRFISVLALWVVFAIFFVDETRSFLRDNSRPTPEWAAAREGGHGIRVVSLNCNVGQSRCVQEVAVWNPDVVLLQESPASERLEQLSHAMFGAEATFLHGGDVSILARGRVRPKPSNPSSHFVHAEVELEAGHKIEVISLRLAPPVFRLDFWIPGFWNDHRKRRIEHRQQILDVMKSVESLPSSTPLIVGGDFNAPPYDNALAPLHGRLFDAFTQAGCGWGATGTNDYPLFRVDHIWATDHFRGETVTAAKTLYSDHRMVVCDLILKDSDAASTE